MLVPDRIHRYELGKQCLHCLNFKAREKIARPLGETVHGNRPRELMHFNSTTTAFVVLRERLDWTKGAASRVSNVVWPEPAVPCTPATTVEHLLTWQETPGPMGI